MNILKKPNSYKPVLFVYDQDENKYYEYAGEIKALVYKERRMGKYKEKKQKLIG